MPGPLGEGPEWVLADLTDAARIAGRVGFDRVGTGQWLCLWVVEAEEQSLMTPP